MEINLTESEVLEELKRLEEPTEDPDMTDSQIVNILEKEAEKEDGDPASQYRVVLRKINAIQNKKKINEITKNRLDKLISKKIAILSANPQFKSITVEPAKEEANDIEFKMPPIELADGEVENAYHNPDYIVSVIALQNERNAINAIEMDAATKESKMQLLEKTENGIKEAIQTGGVSAEYYVQQVTNELSYENSLLAQAKQCNLPELHISRIQKRIELLQQEISECNNYEQEEESSLQVDGSLLTQAEERVADYVKAAEYYIKLKNKERAEAMIIIAKQLKEDVNKLKAGANPSTIQIVGPLTAECFTGIKQSIKKKKLNDVLTVLINQAKLTKGRAKELSEIILHQPEGNTETECINSFKKLAEWASDTQIWIQNIKKVMRDRWTPLPVMSKQILDLQYPIANYDIKSNILNVTISATPNPIDVHASIYYNKKSENIEIKSQNKKIYAFTINCPLAIELTNKANKVVIQIDVNEFNKKCTLEAHATLGVYNVSVIAKIRVSIIPQYTKESYKLLQIDAFLPSFKNSISYATKLKPEIKIVPPETIKKAAETKTKEPQLTIPLGVTKEDIVNPDNLSNLNSYVYNQDVVFIV